MLFFSRVMMKLELLSPSKNDYLQCLGAIITMNKRLSFWASRDIVGGKEMPFFRFESLTEKEKSKLVKGTVIPRPIAWITTITTETIETIETTETTEITEVTDDTINLAPFSFFNAVTSTVLSVSIQRRQKVPVGEVAPLTSDYYKDTALNLLTTGEGVVHIPSQRQLEVMDHSSEVLARDASEVRQLGLELEKSGVIKTPGLKNSLVRFETTLMNQIPITDPTGDFILSDLFLLRIQAVSIDPSIYDEKKGYVIAEALDPVARLGGPNYATITEVKDYKREF